MKIARLSIIKAVEGAMIPGVKKATVYQDEKTVVKATRVHKYDGRDVSASFTLTLGVPNFVERQFIKACKKAGEPLPVRKVQLKWYPGKGPTK